MILVLAGVAVSGIWDVNKNVYHDDADVKVTIGGTDYSLDEAISSGLIGGDTKCNASGVCTQVCIGTDCQTSWPAGGGSIVTDSVTFTNPTRTGSTRGAIPAVILEVWTYTQENARPCVWYPGDSPPCKDNADSYPTNPSCGSQGSGYIDVQIIGSTTQIEDGTSCYLGSTSWDVCEALTDRYSLLHTYCEGWN